MQKVLQSQRSSIITMAITKQQASSAKPAAKGSSKSTAIVPWDKKFAAFAQKAKEQEKSIGGGGTSVKFGPGTITIAGGALPGGKLNCIILGAAFLNTWYGGKSYDSDDPQPPECYAMNEDAEDIAPHDDATNRQSDTCATCEQNVFGSAGTGRGKACGNNKRLAFITAKDAEDADNINGAEVATARISPTNLKAWAGYVRMLTDDHGRPPWAVVTEISSHPDNKTQIRLEFRLVELIEDDDTLNALEKKLTKVPEILLQPYGPPIERPAKVPAGKNKKFAAQTKPAGRH